MKPLVSIVTAVYNAQETLEQTIQSVLSQTYENIEYIIIDGGSTDGSLDTIKKYDDKIAYWVSETDSGIYQAWNKALAHAKGDWVYFLGADDYLWSPSTIQQIVPSLNEAYPEIRVVYGQVSLVTEMGKELQIIGNAPWQKVKRKMRDMMIIPHPGTFHHRDIFDKLGVFNESFKIAGDFELLLRELKTRDALYVPDQTISAMRVGGVSSTPDSSLKLLREQYRARRLNSFMLPGPYLILSFFKVVIRMVLWRLCGEKIAKRILDSGRYLYGAPSYWTKI